MMAEQSSSTERQLAVLMLAAFVLLFVPALFSRGPWHVDDLRYVEAARQMGEYGDVLVPRLNGEVYGEKPPGYSWAIVVTQFATQASYLTAARIVSALAALISGLLLVHLARVIFNSRTTGWIAAGFLWTFVFILDRGTRSLIDSFLYMWTTLGVVTALRAALAENWRARIGWIAATAGAFGYGCLVKGPVALAIPAMGALALGLIWKGRRGVCFSALVIGSLVGGGLTLLWLWQASLVAGPEYLDHLLLDQIRGRVFEQGEERVVARNAHAEPQWFFLLMIPPVALPWIFFLPGSVRAAWRMRFSPEGRAALGVMAWTAAIFVFFSLISGKRAGYVLPLFPPLALGLAWGVMRMQALRDRHWLGMPAALLGWAAPLAGGLIAIAGFLLALMPNETLAALPEDAAKVVRQLDPVRVSVLIGAGVIALIWGSMGLPVLRRSHVGALVLLIPFIGILNAAAHLSIVPAIDPSRSAASFGEAVNRQWNRDERLVELNNQKDGLVTYYCNVRRVEVLAGKNDAETGRLVDNIPGPLWVVARRKDWNRMPESTRAPFAERAAATFNSNEHVLMYRR
jgi:4-amino-4-deoxy-L-arabinose transferase-like glycosyltransferase